MRLAQRSLPRRPLNLGVRAVILYERPWHKVTTFRIYQLNGAERIHRSTFGYHFFLASGERDQEVKYTTWRDINFSDKTASVTEKPDWNFHPKDFEERAIPLPDYLIAALAERRRDSPLVTLVFDNGYGRPEGHFLKKLKKLALRAGLNCGQCIRLDTLKSEPCRKHELCEQRTCKSCRYHPVCTLFSLHKFRRTFASMLMEAQPEVRTIQHLLGHSDISTTLRYLRVADIRSPKMRLQINNSFAGLANTRRRPLQEVNPYIKDAGKDSV
jgi:integrase/recombinase XerD